MDATKIAGELQSFIRDHQAELHASARRETQLLEIGALILTAEHYRLLGYNVRIDNAKDSIFRAKVTSRGHPYNFSWFSCERADNKFEIHSNLAVGGAHDDGAIYVVDVAVVEADVVPRARPKTPWTNVENASLITFVEAKKLVIYPMLLAQFVGIVHELIPMLLGGPAERLDKDNHFYPALVSLGYLKGTSRRILDGFLRRNYKTVRRAQF